MGTAPCRLSTMACEMTDFNICQSNFPREGDRPGEIPVPGPFGAGYRSLMYSFFQIYE